MRTVSGVTKLEKINLSNDFPYESPKALLFSKGEPRAKVINDRFLRVPSGFYDGRSTPTSNLQKALCCLELHQDQWRTWSRVKKGIKRGDLDCKASQRAG